jgi:hypothetical protein
MFNGQTVDVTRHLLILGSDMWKLAAVVATLSRALPAASFQAAPYAPRAACCRGSKSFVRNLKCMHTAATATSNSQHQYQYTQRMSATTNADNGRAEHNAKQAASFDQSVGYFASDAATPPEVSTCY